MINIFINEWSAHLLFFTWDWFEFYFLMHIFRHCSAQSASLSTCKQHEFTDCWNHSSIFSAWLQKMTQLQCNFQARTGHNIPLWMVETLLLFWKYRGHKSNTLFLNDMVNHSIQNPTNFRPIPPVNALTSVIGSGRFHIEQPLYEGHISLSLSLYVYIYIYIYTEGRVLAWRPKQLSALH